jgi:hypothetical protein
MRNDCCARIQQKSEEADAFVRRRADGDFSDGGCSGGIWNWVRLVETSISVFESHFRRKNEWSIRVLHPSTSRL